MSNSEKKLHFKNVYVEINKIQYEKLDNFPQEYSSDIKIITMDNYEVISYSIDGFLLKYCRNVEFDPKYYFTIRVEYLIEYLFDTRTKSEYSSKVDELERVINEKAIKAIEMVGAPSRASTLISSITIQNGCNSVVTQPTFKK